MATTVKTKMRNKLYKEINIYIHKDMFRDVACRFNMKSGRYADPLKFEFSAHMWVIVVEEPQKLTFYPHTVYTYPQEVTSIEVEIQGGVLPYCSKATQPTDEQLSSMVDFIRTLHSTDAKISIAPLANFHKHPGMFNGYDNMAKEFSSTDKGQDGSPSASLYCIEDGNNTPTFSLIIKQTQDEDYKVCDSEVLRVVGKNTYEIVGRGKTNIIYHDNQLLKPTVECFSAFDFKKGLPEVHKYFKEMYPFENLKGRILFTQSFAVGGELNFIKNVVSKATNIDELFYFGYRPEKKYHTYLKFIPTSAKKHLDEIKTKFLKIVDKYQNGVISYEDQLDIFEFSTDPSAAIQIDLQRRLENIILTTTLSNLNKGKTNGNTRTSKCTTSTRRGNSKLSS